MPKWNDFGNIWSTLRELDVSTIRQEAERPLVIACVGSDGAIDTVDRLLHSGAERYGPVGINPVELVPLAQAADRVDALGRSDLLVVALDTREPLGDTNRLFERLERLGLPLLLVLLHGDRPTSGGLPRLAATRTVILRDPAALSAADSLADAVLELLPSELHLAAARRLPGLRATYTRDLIGSTSFTNASYALASGLPEQIPIISVPFAAADMLILTKNQAIMVYRLALASGAPPEFQERIREVIPVVGGAFLWRQAARSLIGLIPVWGLVPKVAIAYAGTYTTGVAAGRWFASGEITSSDQLKRISSDALAAGRARAKEIIDRARRPREQRALPAATELPGQPKPNLFQRIRRALPGGGSDDTPAKP